MKNKIKIILMAVLSMVVVTGCSSTSPTQVVESYFNEIKSGENADIEKYLLDAVNQSGTDETSSTEEDPAMDEAIKLYLEKLDVKSVSEKIDGESATVEVEVTGLSFGKMILEVLEESLNDMFSGTEIDDSEMSNSILEKVKSYETETRKGKVNLTKTDKEWKINIDDSLMSLVFGNVE